MRGKDGIVTSLCIQEILQETRVLGEKELSPEICTIQTSKKNIVVSIHPEDTIPFVVKLFSSSEAMRNELKIYSQIKSSI